jgi:ubiquinone/menaquinone biosynthesis C-methylase UbiE
MMDPSLIAYHQAELRVACDATHPQHLVPDPGDAARILDIGCGGGQTIVALNCRPRCVGVDVDIDALRLAATGVIGEQVRVAAASGERLPFHRGSFDYVYSRVALPYMHIPTALEEMHRVLRPGGRLWLTLHSVAIPLSLFRRTFQIGRLRESIQTERGMRLALRRAGFRRVEFRRTSLHFIVTAER